MRKSDSPVPRDIHAARRRYKRAILTQDDIQEAGAYLRQLHILLDSGSADANAKIHLAALSSAAVVAYARPFSGNHDTKEVAGSIGSDLLAALDDSQLRLHNRLMKLRHEEFAHSSAAASQISVSVFPRKGDHGIDFVLPVRRPLREPLALEEIDAILRLLRFQIAVAFDLADALADRIKAFGPF